ncbi:hypothetical protein STSP_56890 [Streptomyces jeddahensis]|uniref:Uncharacterized protein n=1 Tax=Streptomyces jeddahensis TaxID=1716141 RepID=A0A177HJG6_9ACTN|nr:hypothetical protein STSP_56890 [Streptomyces jeddahensis]
MPEWLVLALAMAAACAVVLVITVTRHRRVSGAWEARGAAQDHVRAEAQALHEVSERSASTRTTCATGSGTTSTCTSAMS